MTHIPSAAVLLIGMLLARPGIAKGAQPKELHATVDFVTYVMRGNGKEPPKKALKPENIRAILTRFSELGITRVYWMHVVEDYIVKVPLTDPKQDLIELVVEEAHKLDMEVWFLFKPFETGQQPGTLRTKSLIFKGPRLSINYKTTTAGSLRIEIQNSAGEALQGFSLVESQKIIGGQIEHVVQWKQGADVSKLAGQLVRLRFVMNDTDLYAFQFQTQTK